MTPNNQKLEPFFSNRSFAVGTLLAIVILLVALNFEGSERNSMFYPLGVVIVTLAIGVVTRLFKVTKTRVR